MGSKNKTRIRFLHCSDVHLDAPFLGISADKSEERRRALRDSFVKMMQYVRETEVNVVLISGDLFDNKFVTNMTTDILVREFRNSPNTEFIIAPGKHDHYNDNPIYTSGRLPKNCHVFMSDTLSRFDFEDFNITVYGWAFLDEKINESPLYDRTVDDSSRVNLVCGYCDLDGEIGTTDCPVSLSELKRFGADYYALGSRHAGGKFLSAGGSKYSYSGSLESMGFENPGVGGANLITVDYGGGELTIEHKQISFSSLVFQTEEIDVSGINTSNEIINAISSMISKKSYGRETALRVILTGFVDPAFLVPKHIENDAFGLYYFKLIDNTLPLHNVDHLHRDMSVKGEVFRQLYPLLTSDDKEERLVGARAFRAALAALENRDMEI
jgi:DNA repair exonuclease SbcCD nuclease subunit